MKKLFLFLGLILILILVTPTSALARGGGGGGGGSGGGGSSSSSESTKSSLSSVIIFGGFIVLSANGYKIKAAFKADNLDDTSTKILKELSKEYNYFNIKKIRKTIKNSFYSVQTGWQAKDYSNTKKYLTEELYKKHMSKLSWMELKNQTNILKNMKLKSIRIVNVNENLNDSKTTLLVRLKASAEDYIINDETKQILDGSYSSGNFIEYWEFKLCDGKWLLDHIYQDDEIDMFSLSNSSSTLK